MNAVPVSQRQMDAVKKIPASISGVFILEPRVFGDERGFFLESYNEKVFTEIGVSERFVQDNHSRSQRNVLRGLHYQIKQAQGKLVRVVEGEILDVAVDLRRSSATFGGWEAVRLSGENKRMTTPVFSVTPSHTVEECMMSYCSSSCIRPMSCGSKSCCTIWMV